MKIRSLIGIAVVVLALASSSAAVGNPVWKRVIDFEEWEAGGLPDRLTPALTGEGGPPEWRIEETEGAPSGRRVLAQTSREDESYRFPLCVVEGITGRNVSVSVRFRADEGSVDRAAGIAWRILDARNYYVVRANALEGNVVLYKMEDGKRKDLKPVGAGLFAYGREAEVPSGRWNKLRVLSKSDRHSVYLNDAHLFDVEDDTFPLAGKVGVWTKADSVTRFDDLVIEIFDGTGSAAPETTP